jgi:hypothetical protein
LTESLRRNGSHLLKEDDVRGAVDLYFRVEAADRLTSLKIPSLATAAL